VSTAVRAKIDRALEGSFTAPRADAPRPQPGKNVWFIPLSSSIDDFSAPGGIHDAAKAMGWKLTEFDGKYSSDNIVSGIRQAIADHADGIVTYVVDCPLIKSALKDARAAGVKVVGGAASDCDEVQSGESALFDSMTRYHSATSDVPVRYQDFLREHWGPAQALAAIAGTGGKAKIIDVTEPDLQPVIQQDKGLRAELEKSCPACEIVDTVSFTGGEVGTPLQQRIEQSLTSHPDANALLSPYDAIAEVSSAAIRSSGRTSQIYHVAAEGKPVVMDAIRNRKGVDAAVGLSLPWENWNMLDDLNRLFHGEKEPADGWPSGNGTQIIDRTSNLPPAGKPYAPPVDFRADYLKAWGVQ
jgi:ribose transport system substrate-binding protein